MRKHVLFALIIASLLLAACGGAAPQATPTPGAPAATETAPAATETAPAAEDTGQPAGELSLTTQPWQWTGFTGAVEQFKVETPASYQVTFNADGTVASWPTATTPPARTPTQDGALTIAVGPMTAAACPDGVAQRPVRQAAGRGCPLLLRRRQALHRPDGRRRHHAA